MYLLELLKLDMILLAVCLFVCFSYRKLLCNTIFSAPLQAQKSCSFVEYTIAGIAFFRRCWSYF